jgi:hypothetical protein
MIVEAPITKAYLSNARVSAKRKLTSLDDFRTRRSSSSDCLLHELIAED